MPTLTEIREAAKIEFEQTTPAPEPPKPPKLPRPAVVKVGTAHVWWDVETIDAGWNQKPRLSTKMYTSENDHRFSGAMDEETVDALIEQLQQVKLNLKERADHLDQASEYEKAARAWNEKRDEFVRQKETAWQGKPGVTK